MTYLLDSDTCIAHLRSGGTHQVSFHLRSSPAGEVGLPTIVASELIYGALRARSPKTAIETRGFCANLAWLPFDAQAAQIHAQLRVDLDRRNGRIGPYDSIIAAVALANNLTLVTHNTSEFGRVTGLKLVDWYLP